MFKLIKKLLKKIKYTIFFNITIDKYLVIKEKYNNVDPVLVDNDYSDEAIKIHVRYSDKIRNVSRRVSNKSWIDEKEKEMENLKRVILGTDELQSVFSDEVGYMKSRNEIMLFPYNFCDKYKDKKILIENANGKDLKYVTHNNKRLFFPKTEDAEDTYRRLLMEQDEKSPHRYFDIDEEIYGDIFIDVGAAEGIMALDLVDRFANIYLLESSVDWVEALEETFSGYKEKVKYYKKYAGAIDSYDTLRLDTILNGVKGKRIYIKMDVEGMELDVLLGAKALLANNDCYISCTTYHNNSISTHLKEFLGENGYIYNDVDGYMVFFYGAMTLQNGMYERLEYPYLRHAILRAHR